MNLNGQTWNVVETFDGTDEFGDELHFTRGPEEMMGCIMRTINHLFGECRGSVTDGDLVEFRVYEPGNDREYILVNHSGFRVVSN